MIIVIRPSLHSYTLTSRDIDFECVTIFFGDIIGFSELVSDCTANEVRLNWEHDAGAECLSQCRHSWPDHYGCYAGPSIHHGREIHSTVAVSPITLNCLN